MMSDVVYYIGVDVGTSSVRAALVDQHGTITETAELGITIHTPSPLFYEQSSAEIWDRCCDVVKKVTKDVPTENVKGIGFDATCSLVVLDDNFDPVSVDQDGEDSRNIVMWMDHRAGKEADFINETGHDVLKTVGGKISLEMQPPKLMWLKKNLPESRWKRAAHFFDLPDFLTWKATGDLSRSMCSVVCKWTYSADKGWDEEFWNKIGLSDLSVDNLKKIGSKIRQIGGSVGDGVCESCAKDTGLKVGTPVAVSIIDGHCGGIGTIGCNIDHLQLSNSKNLENRLALICGTSSCHMAISRRPIFVPGVWGPYNSAMIPGYCLNEGGQSAVASLLDHIVQSHPAYSEARDTAKESSMHPHNFLNEHLQKIAEKRGCAHVDIMTSNLHVLPDFHGNRSPLADPHMKGAIVGLTLDKSLDSLCLLYLATIQGLALGTFHILQALEENGHSIGALFLTGGLQKNPLFVSVHANATGLPIVFGKETETVLLGGAVLAACAANQAPVEDMMQKMCHAGKVVKPSEDCKKFYERKFKVFFMMGESQRKMREIMDE